MLHLPESDRFREQIIYIIAIPIVIFDDPSIDFRDKIKASVYISPAIGDILHSPTAVDDERSALTTAAWPLPGNRDRDRIRFGRFGRSG